MIRRITRLLVSFVKKYLPSAYVLAIALSLVVFVLGWALTKSSFMDMTKYFGDGMYSLLTFTMQIVLVLVTGHALAHAPSVVKVLGRLAKIPRNKAQALAFTAVVSYVATYFNWGFGLIIGALIAKEIARVNFGSKLHYPLLIAAAYSGNLARGPSSSIPLAVATRGHFAESLTGIIPVSETLFSSWNIWITILLMVTIPILFKFMQPSDAESIEIELGKEEVVQPAKDGKKSEWTFSEWIDNSSILSLFFGGACLIYLIDFFARSATFNLNLNIVVMIFLMLGVFAHVTPRRYAAAMQNAIKTSSGITLQFLLYAGIMGMMRHSGLADMLSQWFISVATQQTYPLLTFWSAGLINIFIPSGGGQWAVQGPIMLKAGAELGVDPAITTMAVAWGDSWTNQIQPFWALPMLAIAGLDVKDIMGYCIMTLFLAGVIISAVFAFAV